MQAEVGEARPAAGVSAQGVKGGVGRDSGDAEARQQLVGGPQKPAWVPWLARDREAVLAFAQSAEEGLGDHRVERQARRQLHQQNAELGAQRIELGEEPAKRFLGVHQPGVMGDRAGRLDGEPEAFGRLGRPACVGGGEVGPVERRIDFHGVEHRRVSFKARSVSGKTIGRRARDRPARRADMEVHGRATSPVRRPRPRAAGPGAPCRSPSSSPRRPSSCRRKGHWRCRSAVRPR